MKRIISVAIGATILLAGVCVVYAEGDELTTRSNVKTTDNETLQSSNIPLQKTTPRHENRSEVVNKFRETAYSFSLGFDYVDFEEEISYKDEETAKERLQSATNYLNTLTDNGKDFSAAENLQRNDEWKKFVKDVARLKYEDFDKSEILNDLNVAGALILQAEMHKDKPSLQYLYETINDLNSVVQGNSDKNENTRTFGNDAFEEVQSYLKSKL
ncbi:hypothetical protein [Gracilibacillus lacisalsi]|uniref:hypothetical protein n=1 Tax=Gracilibacillus lacisalsi TaxID=393087 RepID=UPI0003743B09|nr:hypothetical protein [Gracilibacillus lacisalsi]